LLERIEIKQQNSKKKSRKKSFRDEFCFVWSASQGSELEMINSGRARFQKTLGSWIQVSRKEKFLTLMKVNIKGL